MKALLILNGQMPKMLPQLSQYQFVACTDGALIKLKHLDFDLGKLDLISGDFDSFPVLSEEESIIIREKMIETPDQDKTDFHKAVELIINQGFTSIDILGGSGEEMDHFLGNLTTAFQFKEECEMVFYDDYGRYFFSPKEIELNNVNNCNISIYPFHEIKGAYSNGLKWELNNHYFSIKKSIGTRNKAINDTVKIRYEEGDMLLFVGKPVK